MKILPLYKAEFSLDLSKVENLGFNYFLINKIYLGLLINSDEDKTVYQIQIYSPKSERNNYLSQIPNLSIDTNEDIIKNKLIEYKSEYHTFYHEPSWCSEYNIEDNELNLLFSILK